MRLSKPLIVVHETHQSYWKQAVEDPEWPWLAPNDAGVKAV